MEEEAGEEGEVEACLIRRGQGKLRGGRKESEQRSAAGEKKGTRRRRMPHGRRDACQRGREEISGVVGAQGGGVACSRKPKMPTSHRKHFRFHTVLWSNQTDVLSDTCARHETPSRPAPPYRPSLSTIIPPQAIRRN
jgi:hypothetical protein